MKIDVSEFEKIIKEKGRYLIDNGNYILLIDEKYLPEHIKPAPIFALSSALNLPIHIFRYNKKDEMKSVVEEFRGTVGMKDEHSTSEIDVTPIVDGVEQKAVKINLRNKKGIQAGYAKSVTLDKLAETYAKANPESRKTSETLANEILILMGYRDEDLTAYI